MSQLRYFREGARQLPHSLHPTFLTDRLFIHFVKMFGTSGGQESPTVSAGNELNYLLTRFTQKFYEAIKSFQFHFAREIVCGEESRKSS